MESVFIVGLRLRLLATCLIIPTVGVCIIGQPREQEHARLLPGDLGKFHQLGPERLPIKLAKEDQILRPDVFRASLGGDDPSFVGREADYLSPLGDKFTVEAISTRRDSDAYSLLTLVAKRLRDRRAEVSWKSEDFTPVMILWSGGGAFVRGPIFFRLTGPGQRSLDDQVSLSRLLAERLDKGEDDVPVLVKHLPDWQTAQRNAIYAVNIGALRDSISNQSVLNELNFDGGTEAVTANYGQSQLVIVEFTTPQFAGDNDRRIVAKIQELKSLSQSVPTAYRRVGNYSVFVFNAPDEKTANELIDQVRYEQVVQWLGDDPHLYERIQRYFAQKTAGVVIAVLESSGLSVLLCLGVGGLCGALLFRRRRARQRQADAYSDAGGMVRLNLDEINDGSDASRLLQGSNKHG
ncbi:MAG TPA: hypothetical protein VHE60_06385 [Pyrinomonadaceae bacterium]|nr:hypothetical protein [Pyrinomonadaceae bacterium]